MIMFTRYMTISFIMICLWVPNTVFAERMIDSVYVFTDTLIVKEAGLKVVYPISKSQKLAKEKPVLSGESNRGGSFISFDCYFADEYIAIQEILFHSAKSCSAFAKEIANESDNGEDGFPLSWYSPNSFKDQQKALKNSSSSDGYNFIVLPGTNYLVNCQHYDPGAGDGFEAITFVEDVRVMIVFYAAANNCTEDFKKYLALLSKFKLLPTPRK